MSEIEWTRTPVPELLPSTVAEIARLVNAAKWSKPTVFPADRLGPGTLVEEYQECESVYGRINETMVVSMAVAAKERSFWIYLLAVSPDYQGKGLGVKALEQAEILAIERGLDDLRLDVVEQGSLLDFYRAFGFREASRITAPIGKWGAASQFELVTMSKRLKDLESPS